LEEGLGLGDDHPRDKGTGFEANDVGAERRDILTEKGSEREKGGDMAMHSQWIAC
jgi:hypothetical protein